MTGAAGREPDDSQSGAPYIPLPTGLDNPRSVAGGVFDGIAALYDRARPGYPAEALADLLRLCGVSPSTRVLEVGCGTGQFTRGLAPTGASVRAVEPGAALAELARANLAGWPNVEIVISTFEEIDEPSGSTDAVLSATAFHWIDPDVGYAKAARLLRPGGSLGLVTNAHAAGGSHTAEPFARRVGALHRRLAPQVGDWAFPTAEQIERRAVGGDTAADIAAVWARIDRRFGDPPDTSALFFEPTVKAYPWMASYDTERYVEMLASQSSYALMEPAPREELLGGVGRLVDEVLGGSVTKQYVTVLAAAERRRP